ncbi:MAG: GLUG motif-containing protein [Sedimentisphaeraceae bacterium JB056]
MSKSLFWVLACIVICTPVFAYNFSGGSGTLNDPYLIANAEDMVCISLDPFNMSKSFKLVADIDLSGYSDSYIPIGSAGYPFEGHFNGDYYTVSNLTLSSIGEDYVGVFGYQGHQGQIWNLNLDNIQISTQESIYVAAVAGFSSGLIAKCNVSGSNISGSSGVAGIAGYNDGEIKYCNVDTTEVTGEAGVGGIAGHSSTGYIYYCTASVVLNGGDFVGGIAGAQDQLSVIDYCSCSVSINGQESVGGIVGLNTYSTVSNSSSTGFVAGTLYTGGIAGYNLGDLLSSTTDVDVSGGNYVGGIAGYNKFGKILTTTTYGIVTGDQNVDMFVGANIGGIFISEQAAFDYSDFDESGIVDFDDLMIFLEDWLASGSDLQADMIGGDDFVDFADFALFAGQWLVSSD